MKSVVTVYQGKMPTNFSEQPTPISGVKYACGCWAFNKHAILGVSEEGDLLTRFVGNQGLHYTNVHAVGNVYCANGYAYYINRDGEFVKNALVDGGEKLMLSTEEVISSGYANGGFVSDTSVMYFDEGGLRLPTGDRFYPLTSKSSIDDFSAGIYGDYAFFMQDNGSVVLDHNGSRMRVFYGDLSALIIDGVLPGPYVVGRYVRVGNFDDGTVDYVIFPLVGKKLAMPPYTVFMAAASNDGPGFVSIGTTSIAVGTFNNVAVGPIPYWLTDAPYPKARYNNLASSVEVSSKNGMSQVTISFPDEIIDIDEFDKLDIFVWRDEDGIYHNIKMIASDVTAITSGTTKKINVAGEKPVSWLLSNTHLPNYIEMSAGKHVVDFEPWKRETLFSAANPVPQSTIGEVIVDFWDAKPFTHDSISGYEITPGKLSPIESTNIGLEASANLVASGDEINIEIHGWSSSDYDYDNHNVMLFLRLEDDTLYSVGSGHWGKTWDGTTTSPSVISMSIPAGNVTGKIKGVCIGLEADANSNAVAYPASVVFLSGVKELPDTTYIAPWENVDDTRLQLPSQNIESAMFSVSPYSHEDIAVAASFGIYEGDMPNEYGDTVFGFVFGAKDLSNMNAVLLSKSSGNLSVVKVRDGARTTLYEISDSYGILSEIQSGDVGLVFRYSSGKIQLYKTDAMLSEYPGTLVLEYEWKASDGDIAPQIERHVGVYGLVQSPEVKALAWGSSKGELACIASSDLPTSGTLVFIDGSTAEYTGIQSGGVPEGPYQIRNITNWPTEYDNPGLAVAVARLDWDAPSSDYDGKTLSTVTGYSWLISKVDTTPYKIISGSRVYQHDRMRIYSDDITGEEGVGLDTKAYFGGTLLTGVSYSADAFVSPPETTSLKTTERVYITRFVAFEETAASLSDAVCLAANIAGVECQPASYTDVSQETQVKLP